MTIAAFLVAFGLALTAAYASDNGHVRAHHDPVRAPQNRIRSLPADVKIPAYTAGPMPFRNGERLVYRASWLGIPAADATIELRRNPHKALWTAQASIRTSRVVDLVYKMRDYLRETFSRPTFEPRKMYVRQREKHRHDDYTVVFDHADGIVTMRRKNSRGLHIRRFRADHGLGMISGAAMALSQSFALGRSYTYDVFTATNRYVLNFKVAGRDHLVTPMGSFEAWRIVPSVLYLSDKKMRKETRATTIWISADHRKLPLRIDSAVFFGFVRIDLVAIDNANHRSAKGSDG